MELVSKNSGELVGQLCSRYGIGKSSVYNRLQSLNITASRKDGQSFLHERELELLDQLHEWISNGNSMESFPKPGAIVQQGASEIDEASTTIHVEEAESGHQIRQLVRSAQEKAAGLIIAQNMLTAQFKDNPEMLDDDLRQQVKSTEEAIAPKSIDPKRYALSLVDKYRNLATA